MGLDTSIVIFAGSGMPGIATDERPHGICHASGKLRVHREPLDLSK